MTYRATFRLAGWFVMGMVVGTVSGLLFAPLAGKSTRQKLMETAAKTAEQAGSSVAKKSRELMEETGKLMGRTKKAAALP